MINLNCAVLLFSVCRNIISFLRATILNKIVPFDEAIVFHKIVAVSICFWTFVHCVAHYFNYMLISKATKTTTPMFLSFVSGPGLSGQIITLALVLIVTSAVSKIRRSNHEIFWYTHHLFIVFFVGLLAHGSFCFIKADPGPGVDVCRGGPTFWKWWVLSAAVYLAERILRAWRARSIKVTKVIQHPSDVYEIQFEKKFNYVSGQYVFICCPKLAWNQWHPFTITSSPHEKFISCHIRIVGDWTKAFSDLLNSSPETRIRIDGPYGTPSEDVLKREIAILVGGGIGVTPFASLLKSIFYHSISSRRERPPKVYFIWICRDTYSFEWFQSLIATLEQEPIDLEIQMYLTGKLDDDKILNISITDDHRQDPLTGCRHKTFYGRPNFNRILAKIKDDNRGKDIYAYCCGPKSISNNLLKACQTWTDETTKFYFGRGKIFVRFKSSHSF